MSTVIFSDSQKVIQGPIQLLMPRGYGVCGRFIQLSSVYNEEDTL